MRRLISFLVDRHERLVQTSDKRAGSVREIEEPFKAILGRELVKNGSQCIQSLRSSTRTLLDLSDRVEAVVGARDGCCSGRGCRRLLDVIRWRLGADSVTPVLLGLPADGLDWLAEPAAVALPF